MNDPGVRARPPVLSFARAIALSMLTIVRVFVPDATLFTGELGQLLCCLLAPSAGRLCRNAEVASAAAGSIPLQASYQGHHSPMLGQARFPIAADAPQ